MKKYIIMLLLSIFPFVVKANYIGDFTKDINISLNCEQCDPNYEPSVTFQLFADGEPLEDYVIELNNDNEFKHVFEDLPVFKEDTDEEINYEVKYLENGNYVALKEDEVTYRKEKVSKWVQINPEDLEPGHDYVLMTDNWYYEYNDRDPYILLDGDLYHQYVEVVPDYKIIDGKKSYYSLVTEPDAVTIWHFEKLPEDDDLYEFYEGYWELTNYDDLHLVLSAYMGHGSNSYYYKVSDNNGLYDNKTYANRVNITPIEGELGRFKISTEAFWSENHLTTMYLGIGHMVEAKAQREPDYAAHFLAFEYLEDEEVETVYDVVITKVLCETDGANQINPKTGNRKIIVFGIVIALSVSAYILLKYTKVKRYN